MAKATPRLQNAALRMVLGTNVNLLEVSLVVEQILAILEQIEDETVLETIYWFAERQLVQESDKRSPLC